MVSGLMGGIMGGAGITIVISAVDRYSDVFKKVNKGMLALGAGITAMGVAGAMAMGGLIKQAGAFEQTQIAFTTMLGSEEEALALLKELTDFAARTPFTIPEVEKNAKLLLAMGIETKKLLPTLKSLGDVSAGLSVPLERIALNFGQVRTQGKLTGRELRDFNVAGVPLIQELAKNLNIAEKEVKEMVSAGEIGFDLVEQAFISMSGEGGKFFDLMDAQSKTFLGQVSNITDSLVKVARVMGDVFLPAVKAIAENLQLLIGWFEEHPTITKWVAVLLAVFTVASLIIGPLLMLIAILPMVAAGVGAVTVAGLPLWAVIILISIAIAAVIAIIILLITSTQNLKKNWDEFVIGMKAHLRDLQLAFLMWGTKLREIWIKTWGGIQNFFIGIMDSISSYFENKLNAIINGINKVLGSSAFKRFSKFMGWDVGTVENVSFGAFKDGLVDIEGQLKQLDKEFLDGYNKINQQFEASIQPQIEAIRLKKEAEEEVTGEMEKQQEIAKQIPSDINTAVRLLSESITTRTGLERAGYDITSAGTIFDKNTMASKNFQSVEDMAEAEQMMYGKVTAGTSQMTGNTFNIEIENLTGLDSEDISKALSNELGNKISL